MIAKDAAAGKSGIKTYKFGGHTKFVAYAPIKFYTQDYPDAGRIRLDRNGCGCREIQ